MAFYDEVHASQKFRLGTRVRDVAGNEYIYLKGVASTAVGSWVSFDEAHVSTLTVADAQGRIAIAKAAVDATTEFGWYAIYGSHSGLCLASFADNGKVYLTSTAGSVDDADVAGDAVVGAVGRSARNATTGLATFELNYPFAHDLAFD
jgi:hypothetical protein